MKTTKTWWTCLPVAAILALSLVGCSEQSDPIGPESVLPKSAYSATAGPYQFDLNVTDNNNGTWTWIWTVINTNPTNLNKDLSHWNLLLSQCVDFNDIVSAATSSDGTTWVPFNPALASDPSSSSCLNTPVLKFDFGTSGTAPSYYRLVLGEDYAVDPGATAVIKAGANCTVITIPGIGCPAPPDIVYGYETAWGAGTRFTPKGNWGMYFSYPSSSTVNLIAAQTLVVGTVSVQPNLGTGFLDVTYTVNAGNHLAEIHLDLAAIFKDFHLAGKTNNPVPGLFDFKATFPLAPSTTYPLTHTVQTNWPNAVPVLIAAHAVVGIPVSP